MRKTGTKILAVLLAATMLTGLTACGGGKEESPELTKLTIMVDNTVQFADKLHAGSEFEEELERLMGIDIEFIKPDHSGYYDTVSQTFAGSPDNWPDIVLLGSTYYSSYAASGVLADLTDIWENSSVKASGSIANEKAVTDCMVDGRLYGIAPARGNGCVTYVKKSWLDKAGITKVPTTYAEYTAMLDAFAEISPDGYALTSAGLINEEAPYVNYLPEFFQDAYPDFYKNEDGVWVDGFTQDSMKAAMERLIEAYSKGWIDKEFVTNNTANARNKFYADKCGVFTYWAGTWATNLADRLANSGLDSELIAMEPIAEVGQYIERFPTVWAITSACKNPEQAFELFFGTMFDGAEGQVVWTFGVEDVHWSKKAEKVILSTKPVTVLNFADGEFHFKADLETGDAQYMKSHIDPILSYAKFKDGADVSGGAVDERAAEVAQLFFDNCKNAPTIAANSTIAVYQSEIMRLRIELVSQVAAGTISIEDAYARYEAEQGANVKTVLNSLNGK